MGGVGISTLQVNSAQATARAASTELCKKVSLNMSLLLGSFFSFLCYLMFKLKLNVSQVNNRLNVGDLGASVVAPISGFQLERLLAKKNGKVNGNPVESVSVTINGKTFKGDAIKGINDGKKDARKANSANTAIRHSHLHIFA